MASKKTTKKLATKKKVQNQKTNKKFELKEDAREMHCRINTDLFYEENGVQSWRIFRIMSEFVNGFDVLRKYSTAATFFGGARFRPNDPEYKAAEELAMKLAKSGFSISKFGT